MKLNTMTAILLSTVLAATTLPAMAQDTGDAPKAGRGFAMLDANGDGTVSQEEFDAIADARFAAADANGDGVLSEEELKSSGDRKGRKGGKQREVTDEQRAERATKMIEAKDTNGDGLLSAEELATPVDVFAKLDADGNGVLSEEEFAKAREMMRGKGKERR